MLASDAWPNSKGAQWELQETSCASPDACLRLTSTLFGDQLVTFGGRADAGHSGDLAVLNTVTWSWWRPMQTGLSPIPREGHSATACGKLMIIFGGLSLLEISKDVVVLDTETWAWECPTVSGLIAVGRHKHTAVLSAQSVVVFGGFDDGGCVVNDVKVLNVAFWRWTEPEIKGKPPSGRESHSACGFGDQMVVFGGFTEGGESNEVHILNMRTWIWSQPAVTGTVLPRTGHGAQAVGKQILVMGGFTARTYINELSMLDTETWTWSQPVLQGPAPMERQGHCLVGVCGGTQVLAMFGETQTGLVNDIWRLQVPRAAPEVEVKLLTPEKPPQVTEQKLDPPMSPLTSTPMRSTRGTPQRSSERNRSGSPPKR
mmetsp:Transcript_6463/g.14921  ORF Transcript_6463/g.14921 Transcript_6463/m.14921 type:complete len:372 (-) Transcript_6463:248-1363(-)